MSEAKQSEHAPQAALLLDTVVYWLRAVQQGGEKTRVRMYFKGWSGGDVRLGFEAGDAADTGTYAAGDVEDEAGNPLALLRPEAAETVAETDTVAPMAPAVRPQAAPLDFIRQAFNGYLALAVEKRWPTIVWQEAALARLGMAFGFIAALDAVGDKRAEKLAKSLFEQLDWRQLPGEPAKGLERVRGPYYVLLPDGRKHYLSDPKHNLSVLGDDGSPMGWSFLHYGYEHDIVEKSNDLASNQRVLPVTDYVGYRVGAYKFRYNGGLLFHPAYKGNERNLLDGSWSTHT